MGIFLIGDISFRICQNVYFLFLYLCVGRRIHCSITTTTTISHRSSVPLSWSSRPIQVGYTRWAAEILIVFLCVLYFAFLLGNSEQLLQSTPQPQFFFLFDLIVCFVFFKHKFNLDGSRKSGKRNLSTFCSAWYFLFNFISIICGWMCREARCWVFLERWRRATC